MAQLRAADENTRELWAEWIRLEGLTLGEAIRRSKVEAAPFWLWTGAADSPGPSGHGQGGGGGGPPGGPPGGPRKRAASPPTFTNNAGADSGGPPAKAARTTSNALLADAETYVNELEKNAGPSKDPEEDKPLV